MPRRRGPARGGADHHGALTSVFRAAPDWPIIRSHELNTAYRQAALYRHPDKKGGSKEAFVALQEAFDMLSLSAPPANQATATAASPMPPQPTPRQTRPASPPEPPSATQPQPRRRGPERARPASPGVPPPQTGHMPEERPGAQPYARAYQPPYVPKSADPTVAGRQRKAALQADLKDLIASTCGQKAYEWATQFMKKGSRSPEAEIFRYQLEIAHILKSSKDIPGCRITILATNLSRGAVFEPDPALVLQAIKNMTKD